MHRASPTLLFVATCLAGSLLTAAPAAAVDDATPPPPPVLLSPSPSATESEPESPIAPTDETADEAGPDAPPTFALDQPSPLADGTPTPFATPGRGNDVLITTNVVMAATTDAPTAASLTPPRTRLPLRKGHYGSKVSLLQARLAWLGYPTPQSVLERGAFGKTTKSAVKAFQVKNWLPATGVVNQRTWKLLKKQSTPIGSLPEECTEVKMSLCIDKTAKVLRMVVKGKVKLTTDARFGAPGMETDEGVFAVKEKSFNHTSTKYHTWMPRAMFFNGDEAVHYSPDFNAYGYAHGSHGCVGVRDMDVATTLFNKVPVGTRVFVYWS